MVVLMLSVLYSSLILFLYNSTSNCEVCSDCVALTKEELIIYSHAKYILILASCILWIIWIRHEMKNAYEIKE